MARWENENTHTMCFARTSHSRSTTNNIICSVPRELCFSKWHTPMRQAAANLFNILLMPWQMNPRLLCEFLSFYLPSSLMVSAQTKKNKQTHASSRSLFSHHHVACTAKEQRADWQHNPDCASAAAKILTNTHAAEQCLMLSGSFRCRREISVSFVLWLVLKKRKSHARGCKAESLAQKSRTLHAQKKYTLFRRLNKEHLCAFW